jgi:hypothetical protein
MKIQDFFTEAFYINLDKRTDRRAEFEAEMARVGLSDFVKRFPAPVDLTHLPKDDYAKHRACTHAHYQLVKYAAEKDLPNILIFEDDAYFYDEGQKSGLSIVEAALDALASIPDWGIFYLGGFPLVVPDRPPEESRLISPNLVRISAAFTAHAWAFNKNSYRHLLERDPEYTWPLDGWMTGQFHIPKYMAYPLAVPQRFGRSDLAAGEVGCGIGEYHDHFRKLTAELKRTRQL